jgi:hypothetical protein
MKAVIIGVVSVPVHDLGESRSVPATVGSPVPSFPAIPPRPAEHPQAISTPAGDNVIEPLEPRNDSMLAI